MTRGKADQFLHDFQQIHPPKGKEAMSDGKKESGQAIGRQERERGEFPRLARLAGERYDRLANETIDQELGAARDKADEEDIRLRLRKAGRGEQATGEKVVGKISLSIDRESRDIITECLADLHRGVADNLRAAELARDAARLAALETRRLQQVAGADERARDAGAAGDHRSRFVRFVLRGVAGLLGRRIGGG